MESTLWIEKYRPSTFAEIKGQKEIIKRVAAFVKQKNLPHLLFTGPAGVGKTSLSLVIVKQLYGEYWRENFLELNASDERGIDVIRTKVKDFARTRALSDIPFKIIYLDECDALTREAQQALRRTMENTTQTTRFILSANYSSKIIDPIQSRCAIFRFKPLPQEDLKELIGHIAKKEGLHFSGKSEEALITASGGDCRRLQNVMQSCAAFSKTISEEDVYSIASFARPTEIKEILEASLSGDFLQARDKLFSTMQHYGLSGVDVIKQIQEGIYLLPMDGRKKVELIQLCGEIEFRLSEGSDEFIQLEAFLASIAAAGM